MKQQARTRDDGEIENPTKLIEIQSRLEVIVIEFESKDLSLIFIKFKLIRFLPGLQFSSRIVTRPSNCGFDSG